LECAKTANVDFIISGDIHLLELKQYDKVKIVTAKEYLEMKGQAPDVKKPSLNFLI